jgi:pimeloyl-ACP methyl ester carboxylesterase
MCVPRALTRRGTGSRRGNIEGGTCPELRRRSAIDPRNSGQGRRLGAVHRQAGPALGAGVGPDFAGTGTRARAGRTFTLRRQAVALIDQRPRARFVVVGRSMVGQVTELVAQASSERIAARVLMAAVPPSGHESTDEA